MRKKRQLYHTKKSILLAEQFDMPISLILRAGALFSTQKNHARSRLIEFNITFEEWIQWWKDNIGDDWIYKRGRGAGKFHMARKNDEGPYELSNIICLTHEQNGHYKAISGKASSGEKHATRVKLLKSEVIEIFNSSESHAALARKYNVSDGAVWAIRNGRSWIRVTKGICK